MGRQGGLKGRTCGTPYCPLQRTAQLPDSVRIVAKQNRSAVQLSIGSQLVHCRLAIPRHESPNPYKIYSSYALASLSQSSVYTHLSQVQPVYTHLSQVQPVYTHVWKVFACLWWKRSLLYLVTPMAVLTTGLPGSCKHTDEVCQHLRAGPVTLPPGREVTHLLLSPCAKLGELRLHILVATAQFLMHER